MNALMISMADQRSKELRDLASDRRRAGRRHRRTRSARPASIVLEQISIRRLGDGDTEALVRLAGRDSSRVPAGEMLGAEVDGRLIAAVSITTGEAVADPFSPTAEVAETLERRAAQVRTADAAHHGGTGARRHSLRGLSVRARRG